MNRLNPNEAIYSIRISKKGFSPPIPYWINGSLKPLIQEVLSEDSIKKTGILQPQLIQKMLKEHWEKKKDHHRRIWSVLNFVLWYNKWVS